MTRDFIKALKKFKQTYDDCIFTVRCPFCEKVIDRNEFACKKCTAAIPETPMVNYAVGGYKCVSPLPYQGIFKDAVRSFKFRGNGVYSKPLAYFLSLCVKEMYNDKTFDVVTCVPMHKNLLKQRGYNQAELLAKECSGYLQIEYSDLLEKFRENKPQHSIKGKERQRNVRGVYRIFDKNLVKDKNILIIDDIITTGNTLGECARVLTNAGCKSISCAAVCAVTHGVYADHKKKQE